MEELKLVVNGREECVLIDPGETLLHVLRERLHLTGTKEGCREGECGACTVLVDDRPVDSCIYAAMAAAGRAVETIESLGNTDSPAPPATSNGGSGQRPVWLLYPRPRDDAYRPAAPEFKPHAGAGAGVYGR